MSAQSLEHRLTHAKLGVFSLVMLTVVSVDSVRNLPTTALFGSSLIFFFVLAAVFFLLPCAFVAAELSSRKNDQGGIYVWVREAFGKEAGFFAVWFQWIENVIWYPAILSFVAGTIGYLIDPTLADKPFFHIGVVLVAFWLATGINLLGMQASAWFSNFCAIVGLLLPMATIICLGAAWLVLGNPIEINFDWHHLLPGAHHSNLWVSLTGIVLSFGGMEIATVHARDVDNPERAFPRAIMISVLIIVGTLVLGSLAIAAVIPQNDISLVAGIMQAFDAFLSAYHLKAFLPLLAIFLIIGGLGSVSNWIIAPTRGLMIAGREGNLPVYLQHQNHYRAPTRLLIGQALIVTALCSLYVLMPSVNGSYWLMTALASQLYMIMYVIMFITVVYLRFWRTEHPPAYRVPGGKLGLIIVATFGLIGAITTFIVGFIPPADINVGTAQHYEMLLVSGLLLMSAPPFVVYHLRSPKWQTVSAQQD